MGDEREPSRGSQEPDERDDARAGAGGGEVASPAQPFEPVVAQLDERERVARNDITEASTPAEKATAEKNLAIAQDLKRAQVFYASR